jgi:anthranilate phosphoribosyltransferase
MSIEQNKEFGSLITRVIQRENLTREQSREVFFTILGNQTTDMQQGAFLAALTAKGETEEEVAGAWEAIYDLDTTKVKIDEEVRLVENSGTGMDTFKTFNISTAASIIAAAGGIPLARHGARAITSMIGTVDMAEALGVDVECSADVVMNSIKKCGLGLFNGMSPNIHPKALGRILSQIYFGSTLNIAASLANPALPRIGVRGVYSRNMIIPVAKVMKEIGYKSAIVLNGSIDGSELSMDEASVCGSTHCAKISENGEISQFEIDPKALGLGVKDCNDLAPEKEIKKEAKRFVSLIGNREKGPRKNATLLNAGLIYFAAGKAASIDQGIEKAARALEKGAAFETLEKWVSSQNTNPSKGLNTLHSLV